MPRCREILLSDLTRVQLSSNVLVAVGLHDTCERAISSRGIVLMMKRPEIPQVVPSTSGNRNDVVNLPAQA